MHVPTKDWLPYGQWIKNLNFDNIDFFDNIYHILIKYQTCCKRKLLLGLHVLQVPLRPPQWVCEAYLGHDCKPCFIAAIPSQIGLQAWLR